MDLKNKFLIASPSMDDSIFNDAVIYVCEHNPGGAMGIIINKPLEIHLSELFDQLDIHCEDQSISSIPILFGGPVQNDRMFVLHSSDQNINSMIRVSDEVSLTASKPIIEAIAKGEGPENVLISIGYAGWDASQLENEVSHNFWLTVEADTNIIFKTPFEKRFDAAMSLLGVQRASLSSEAGHA